jgi:hypothetical protein
MTESNTAHSIAPLNGHKIQPNATDIATSMNARMPFSRLLERVLINLTCLNERSPVTEARNPFPESLP